MPRAPDIYGGSKPWDVPAYTLPVAARHVRVPAATLRYWVVGREYVYNGKPCHALPLIRVPVTRQPFTEAEFEIRDSTAIRSPVLIDARPSGSRSEAASSVAPQSRPQQSDAEPCLRGPRPLSSADGRRRAASRSAESSTAS